MDHLQRTRNHPGGRHHLKLPLWADRARFKQTNTTTNQTTYIGGLYEKQVNSVTSLTTHVHYIKVGGSTIAIYKATENSNTNSNSNTNTTGTEATTTETTSVQ